MQSRNVYFNWLGVFPQLIPIIGTKKAAPFLPPFPDFQTHKNNSSNGLFNAKGQKLKNFFIEYMSSLNLFVPFQ